MDEWKRSHVPAFGSWDYNGDLHFSQCFESARQFGLHRQSYSEDSDLYVAGDLYDNNILTPAMILVPRRRAKALNQRVKEAKKVDWKEPPCPPPPRQAVDEDLYKISPALICQTPKRNRARCFFSSCLLPICY